MENCKIIALTNQKGGVGKTTSCVNIAAQVGKKGKKVLMIDMDPQGNATSGLGIAKSKIKNTNFKFPFSLSFWPSHTACGISVF